MMSQLGSAAGLAARSAAPVPERAVLSVVFRLTFRSAMLTYFGFMLQRSERRRNDLTRGMLGPATRGRAPVLPEFARAGKLVELARKMRHHSGSKAAGLTRPVLRGGEHGCTVL